MYCFVEIEMHVNELQAKYFAKQDVVCVTARINL